MKMPGKIVRNKRRLVRNGRMMAVYIPQFFWFAILELS
jgi:hypothetical protein